MDILKKLILGGGHIKCKDLEVRAEGEEQEEAVGLDQNNWGQTWWDELRKAGGALSEPCLACGFQ